MEVEYVFEANEETRKAIGWESGEGMATRAMVHGWIDKCVKATLESVVADYLDARAAEGVGDG